MKIRVIIAALIAAPLAVSGFATAHTIEGNCGDNTFAGRHVTAIGDGDSTIYVDDRDHWGTGVDEIDDPVEDATEPEDEHDDQYAFSVWIYAESGNHPGLQTKAGTVSSLDGEGLEVCSTGAHGGSGGAAKDKSDLLLW